MNSEVRDRVMVAIGQGATVESVAEIAGVVPRTFHGWLAKGRKDPDGEYGAFARAFDSRGQALGTGPMTDEEYELHLADAIRRKNVQAMKIYEDRRARRANEDDEKPAADPLGGIDELATLRNQRAA